MVKYRRNFLSSLVILCCCSRFTEATTLSPTPRQSMGPFYPSSLPADRDHDLVQILGHKAEAKGERLDLRGRVRAIDGKPLAGARVEIWQCDVTGRYLVEKGTRDENFQGYGESITDQEGNYQFRTIRPVAYGGRPPHIHFQISHQGKRNLVTQMYIAGETGNDAGWFGGAEVRERLTVKLQKANEPGAWMAQFDIVMGE